VKFHGNIKIPQKKANFAAQLEILQPAKNCGSCIISVILWWYLNKFLSCMCRKFSFGTKAAS